MQTGCQTALFGLAPKGGRGGGRGRGIGRGRGRGRGGGRGFKGGFKNFFFNMEGSDVEIAAASAELERYRSDCNDRLQVNGRDVGAVIGKGGSMIKSIQRRVGRINIDIPKTKTTAAVYITLKGTPDKIDQARELILAAIDESKSAYEDRCAARAVRQREREERQAAKRARHQAYLRRQREAAERRRLWILYECVSQATALRIRRAGCEMTAKAREVTVSDEVWDGQGFTWVTAYKLAPEKTVYTLRTATGRAVTATGNHAVFLASGGSKRMDALVEGDVLLGAGGAAEKVSAVTTSRDRPMQLNTASGRLCVQGLVLGDSAAVVATAAAAGPKDTGAEEGDVPQVPALWAPTVSA